MNNIYRMASKFHAMSAQKHRYWSGMDILELELILADKMSRLQNLKDPSSDLYQRIGPTVAHAQKVDLLKTIKNIKETILASKAENLDNEISFFYRMIELVKSNRQSPTQAKNLLSKQFPYKNTDQFKFLLSDIEDPEDQQIAREILD